MEEAPFGDALNVVACSDRLAVFSQQGACVGKTKGRKAKPAEGKEPREPKAKAAPSQKKKTQSPQVCQRVNRSVGALQKQLQMRTRSTNQSDIPKGNPTWSSKTKPTSCRAFEYARRTTHRLWSLRESLRRPNLFSNFLNLIKLGFTFNLVTLFHFSQQSGDGAFAVCRSGDRPEDWWARTCICWDCWSSTTGCCCRFRTGCKGCWWSWEWVGFRGWPWRCLPSPATCYRGACVFQCLQKIYEVERGR